MKEKNIELLSDKQFRRVVGVKRKTFAVILEVVIKAHAEKKARGGRPNKLSVTEMILMTLEYLREYRTYASIGASYGLAEANAFQTIRWVENVLIKCGKFRLPGKNALIKAGNTVTVVLIDATESPIERPKKNKKSFTQARKNDTQ
jgi:hypothetical protein